MHSTSKWTSHSERSSSLPRMWWPLSQLRFILVLLHALLLVGEQRGRPEQRRRVRQKPKAALVASRFVCVVHACRSADALPQSAKTSRSERPCLTFGTFFFATRGTTGKGLPRSCTICLSRAVSRFGSARRTSSSVHRCSAKSIRDLAKSRIGIVLVTPALLSRLAGEGIADKELSALLARDLLVPIVHDTTYEDLREVSPLLGSRSGLSTAEEPMADVAAKLAELVAL